MTWTILRQGPVNPMNNDDITPHGVTTQMSASNPTLPPSTCQDKNACVWDSSFTSNTHWEKQLQVLPQVNQTNQITTSTNNKTIFLSKQQPYTAGGFVPWWANRRKARPEQLLIRWAPFCLYSKWSKCHMEKKKPTTVYCLVIRHGNTGISKTGEKTDTNCSSTGNLFLGVYNFWRSWTLTLPFL